MTLSRRLTIAAGATLLAVGSAAAQAATAAPAPLRCEVHGPTDVLSDKRAATLLQQHPSNLLEVCTGDGQSPGYSLLTVPAHAGPELCSYTRQLLGGDSRPEVWSRVERGACPKPGGTDYFSVADVPDDVLLRLVALQRDMAASDAAFDKALEGLDAARGAQASSRFDDFRRAMRSGRTHLLGVERVGPFDEPKGGFFLTFDDSASPSTSWRLGVVPFGDRLLVREIAQGAAD